jgi:hypothetical protein
MANARNLAGTRYGIDRDYPYEIRTARKALWPAYKEYRSRKGNKVQLKYPAALYVNHRLVEDAFPGWELLLNPSRDIGQKPPKVFSTSDNSNYSGHQAAYTAPHGIPDGVSRAQQDPPLDNSNEISFNHNRHVTNNMQQTNGVNKQVSTASVSSQSSYTNNTNNSQSQSLLKSQSQTFVQPTTPVVNIDNITPRGRPRSRANSMSTKSRGRSTSARAQRESAATRKAPANQQSVRQTMTPPTTTQHTSASNDHTVGGD